MARTTHSYFVVMVDHPGRGLEAVVHPENTRRKTVEMIADGGYSNVVFIHSVDGLFVEDVTLELLDEAETMLREAGGTRARQVAANFDHVRDLLKHEVA